MLPPREIPPALYNDFTLAGKIAVQNWYLNDTTTQPRIYTKKMIDDLIKAARERRELYYGLTDRWFYQTLAEYSIKGKPVVVYGSQIPWYESICLSFGAQCTVIDYQAITARHPAITALTPAQYEQAPCLFAAAVSISSFEHDGLGRYGDPLNPGGDLLAMAKARSALYPGGLLFLAVPCASQDVLVWNAHRIYGPERLPLLLAGWEILALFGNIYTGQPSADGYTQPVFVLRKPTGPSPPPTGPLPVSGKP